MPERQICIYHGGCVDGFTSAWIAWRATHGNIDPVAGVYGEPPPDVKGRDVLMLDFSYPADVIADMARVVNKMLILDHHKTAEKNLFQWTRPFPLDDDEFVLKPGETRAHFDMMRSGAGMTWDYFYPSGNPRPRLVNHVEDRDLWTFNALGTREIGAVLYSHEFDFLTWESLMIEMEDEDSYRRLISQGEAIDRAHKRNCEHLIRRACRPMKIANQIVPVVNAPYFMSSDIGNMLASNSTNGSRIGATYYDDMDGKRIFSIRSTKDGPDVSDIAVRYGGGGHKNAAGFTAPHPNWLGEQDGPA